jgi:23S rRNA pseudouridine1911/1915/1917 synthase
MATYLPKRCVDFKNGKPARTTFRVLRRSDRYTGLEVVPETGRTNQIRVHLAHAGHPIVGDKVFALNGDLRDEIRRDGLTARVKEALVLDRHALHCASLRFAHPMTGEPIEIEAPVPGDIAPYFSPASG